MRQSLGGGLAVASLILIAGIGIAFAIGRYPVSLIELGRVLLAKITGEPSGLPPAIETVVWQIRGPRVVAAVLVGAGLSVAGAAFQGLFRNPLVSPDILGASSGAALGAVLGIYFSLGVFGIDIYDNFQGAYHEDLDYGVFRYADRRIVQGMKMWTWGYGPNAKSYEQGYTDKAGPYVEVQSGRHVWDGHYEWVEPHKTESWSEWWIPVSGLGGLTTTTRDVALHVKADGEGPGRLAVAVWRCSAAGTAPRRRGG